MTVTPPGAAISVDRVMAVAPSSRGSLFPYREVAVRAGQPSDWVNGVPDAPVELPWPGGPISRSEFLRRTNTNAFVVVRDGLITEEWYREGVDPQQLHSSWSVAKSVVSLLLGRTIEQGLLTLDDRLTGILPELATGGDFDQVTVRQLANMASGIDVPEHTEGSGIGIGTRGLYFTNDIPAFLSRFRTVSSQPGTVGAYRSVDTSYLGLILAAVTGRSLAELAAEWIWKPIGAQTPARWNLDRADGVEKAFCCFNATARDFAKFGSMVAASGVVDGERLISPAWMSLISHPAELPVGGLPYSAHWWQVERDGQEGDFSAIGIHGQYVYVNPKRNVSIVKLSDYGPEQDEWETLFALRRIAIDGTGVLPATADGSEA